MILGSTDMDYKYTGSDFVFLLKMLVLRKICKMHSQTYYVALYPGLLVMIKPNLVF